MASSILSNPRRDMVPGQITVDRGQHVFAVISGRRWTRIARYLSNGQLTAMFFVDETTGEVRESEGWKKPKRWPVTQEYAAYALAIIGEARDVPEKKSQRPNRFEELRLRMLGENVTFARHQWEELLESLVPGSELAVRIARMLEQS